MEKEIKEIAKKYKIDLIVLFGSLAKGNERSESDADIGISRNKSFELEEDLQLRQDLQQIFKREIDIVEIKRASPLLLGEIAKNSRLLYGKKDKFTEMKILAMKKYIDFKPYFKLREELIRKYIKNDK